MGVIVIILETPTCTGENLECTWEHLEGLATGPSVLATCQGEPVTSLDVPVTSLRTPRITTEQFGKNIFLQNPADAPGIQSMYLSFNNH